MNLQKIRAYGDPRLFALNLVSDQFAKSAQPIVPERLLIMGGGGGKDGEGKVELGSVNVLSQLLGLLLAKKDGIGVTEKMLGVEALEKYADEMTKTINKPVESAGNDCGKKS